MVSLVFISLALVSLLTLTLSLGLGDLKVDSSNESLFQEDDPVLQSYQNFQSQFGRNDIVVAAISSKEIFTSGFISKLENFHSELEQSVPWLDDVTSIVNADWIEGGPNNSLNVTEMGEIWPKEGQLPSHRIQEITSSPLYRNTLVSADGEMTFVIIRALTHSSNTKEESNIEGDFFAEQVDTPELSESVENTATEQGLTSVQLEEYVVAIEEVVKKHKNEGLTIYLAGGPLLDKIHHDVIHHDASTLVGSALIVILVALFFLFRTKTALVVPVIVIIASLISIIGLMGWLESPITPISQALPPLLLMAGVLDSVHILGLYYANRRQGMNTRQSIIHTFDHSGVAVVITTLTTAAGFLAFTAARMKPISDFGWLASLGVILVLIYTLLLIPALIRLWPGRIAENVQKQIWQRFATSMRKVASIGDRYANKVILGIVVIVIAGFPGVMKTDFSYDVLSWFPSDTPIRVDTMTIDEKIKSTVPLEVIIDTDRENGILTPEFMQKLREFQDFAEQFDDGVVSVGRATSIVDTLQRIHSQLDKGSELGSLPASENLIHQEMLLYESGGPREIIRLVDRQYSKVRITLRLAWADGRDMIPLREAVHKKAKSIFSGMGSVEVTGTVDLVATGAIDIIASMSKSYLFAALTITAMLIVLWRSVKLGILAMTPNFITIYVCVAIMGYLGISMNMITVLLGSIALGLAVDDTVHIINGIRTKIQGDGAELASAIEHTLVKIGPMLAITSMVLAGGFAMFSFSMMSALSIFGIMLSLTIVIALLVDLLVIPAMLKTFGVRVISSHLETKNASA